MPQVPGKRSKCAGRRAAIRNAPPVLNGLGPPEFRLRRGKIGLKEGGERQQDAVVGAYKCCFGWRGSWKVGMLDMCRNCAGGYLRPGDCII